MMTLASDNGDRNTGNTWGQRIYDAAESVETGVKIAAVQKKSADAGQRRNESRSRYMLCVDLKSQSWLFFDHFLHNDFFFF